MAVRAGPCQAGTLVLTSRPFVHTVSESQRLILCNFCFTKCETLQRCSACTVLRYCSRKCQKGDWQVHKKECRYLKNYSPKVPTESIKLFLRLLLKHQDKETTSIVEEKYGLSRRFEDLMGHVDEIRKDEKRMQQFLTITEGLKRHLLVSLDDFSAADLLGIFGRMTVNSFSICDAEMQPVGVGLYLIPSKLDHSCRPNGVITFRGTELQLRTTETLTALSEIRISYISDLNTTSERQRQLEEQYYFRCDCSGCKDNLQEQQMHSSCCPTLGCVGRVLWNQDEPLHCDKCGTTEFRDEYVSGRNKGLSLVHSVLEKIKELKNSQDDDEVLRTCREFLHTHNDALHPSNIHVARLLELAFDACVNLQRWSEALDFGEKTLESYQLHGYGEQLHPSLGIQLMKVGKIYLHLNQKGSEKHLSQAERILTVTHGTDSQLFSDLKEIQLQSSLLQLSS